MQGTDTAFKNELLFSQFGINYAHLPEQFRKVSHLKYIQQYKNTTGCITTVQQVILSTADLCAMPLSLCNAHEERVEIWWLNSCRAQSAAAGHW
jgi:hypothetical protein